MKLLPITNLPERSGEIFMISFISMTAGEPSAWAAGPKYGPYLIKVPPLKTGTYKDETAIAAPGAVPPAAEVASNGWLYDTATGSIWGNDLNHFDK